MAARKSIPAAAFMASFSSTGRPEPVRYDAARGCSHPNTVVERWNGHKFVEVELTWNGTNYEESK